MLGTHTGTLTLHTLDIGSSYLTRQQRVFTIVFKVTTAQRITVQVHTRTQDDVTAVFLGFVTNGFTHLGYQFRIPGRGQTRTDRECRGIVSLRSTLAGGVDAHTGRTVSQYSGRNAQSCYLSSITGSPGHQVSLTANDSALAKEIVGTANQ